MLVLLLLATLLFHGIMTFVVFKTGEAFDKYPAAASGFINHRMPRERTIDFSPLYLSLHVAAHRWLPEPIQTVRGIQVLLVTFAGLFLYLLLRRRFSPRWAMIGLIAYTISPSILLYERALEPEALMLFFLLGFLWVAAKHGTRNWIVAGLFFSLLLATRATFLPLLLVLPFVVRQQRTHQHRWFPGWAIFMVPVLLTVAAVLGWNWHCQGRFVPHVMNPGYVFFEGNNPNSTGQSAIYPPLVDDAAWDFTGQPDVQHHLYRLFARRISGRALSVTQVNRFWTEKALEFIRDHPERFVRLLLLKAYYILHNYRRHDLASVYWSDQRLVSTGIPLLPFSLLVVLAVAGMLIQLSEWKHLLLVYAAFLTQAAVMMTTYVSDRQRLTLIPLCILFAIGALSRMVQDRRVMVIVVCLGLPATLLLTVPSQLMKDEDHLWRRYRDHAEYWMQARGARNHRQLNRALRLSARALAATPWQPYRVRPAGVPLHGRGIAARALEFLPPAATESERYDRAILLVEAGRFGEAEPILRDLITRRVRFKRDFDHCSEPAYYLAKILRERNEPDAARHALQSGLSRSPGNPFLLAELFAATEDVRYKQDLYRYFDRITANFFIAVSLMETGAPGRARPFSEYVIRTLPEYRRGHLLSAVVNARCGREDAAVKAFLRAVNIRSDPVFWEEDILGAFGRWCGDEPHSRRRQYLYGVALRFYGRFSEALEIQTRLLRQDPDDPSSRKEIEILRQELRSEK